MSNQENEVRANQSLKLGPKLTKLFLGVIGSDLIATPIHESSHAAALILTGNGVQDIEIKSSMMMTRKIFSLVGLPMDPWSSLDGWSGKTTPEYTYMSNALENQLVMLAPVIVASFIIALGIGSTTNRLLKSKNQILNPSSIIDVLTPILITSPFIYGIIQALLLADKANSDIYLAAQDAVSLGENYIIYYAAFIVFLVVAIGNAAIIAGISYFMESELDKFYEKN